MLTLGSLFDGIGGFPFCAELSGVIPVWASEIDPACIAVTRQHFSNMQHLGDVSKVNGASIPPVDIITFGSPCQDLSVAGQRKGIKHVEKGGEETTRSGLFLEAIRIIYEMRAATYGMYPTYIVWENVPGAFSSQCGRDFQTVLQEITKTDIPIPPSGRWSTAGVVRGGGICVAWRQLDAQYWGVPQHRKRIYLVGSFGNDSAAEILFKCDSVQGYLTQSGGQGEGIAAAAENGVGGYGRVCSTITCTIDRASFNQGEKAQYDFEISDSGINPTIVAKGPSAVAYGISSQNSNAMMSDNPNSGFYEAKTSRTLDHNGSNPTCNQGGIAIVSKAPCTTAYAIGNGQADNTGLHEYVGALNCMHDQQAVLYLHAYDWIVRRLTPLECERLQGYPDYWTVLPKISDMSDEDYAFWKEVYILDKQIRGKLFRKEPTKKEILKRYNSLDSDSPRYRMLGNSLAIPCAFRVINGIADYMRGEAEC